MISAATIQACFARFEGRLISENAAGDQIIVLGEIVDTEVDDNVFEGEGFDPKKADPLMHVGSVDFARVGDIITAEGLR